MTPLVLRVYMGGGDRLPSGDPYARLPSYHKKNAKWFIYCGYGDSMGVLCGVFEDVMKKKKKNTSDKWRCDLYL